MDSRKNTTGWILCPSKGFPGKFYYFNVVTGQAVWSPNFGDVLKKNPSIHQISGSHDYPEPDTNPNDYSPSVSSSSSFKKPETPVQQSRVHAMQPSFGQAMFPNYIQSDNNMMPMTWVPMIPMCNFMPRQPSAWEPNYFAKDPPTSIKVPNAKNPWLKRKVCSTETQTDRARIPCQVVFKKSKLFSNFESNQFPLGKFSKSCENLNLLDLPNSNRFEKSVAASNLNKEFGLHSHRKVISSSLSDESICEKMGTLFSGNIVQNSNNKLYNLYRNQQSKEKSVPIPETFGLKSTAVQTKEFFVNTSKCNQFSNLVNDNKVHKSNERMKDGVNKDSLNQKVLNLPIVYENAIEKDALSKGDMVDNLDKSDLRFLLMAKRRRSCDTMRPDNDEKPNAHVPTAKKRMTFDIDEYDNISVNSSTSQCKEPVNNLGILAKPTMNSDSWYIIVDTDTLLEDFEFIQSFIKADSKCRMYIPSALNMEIIKRSINIDLCRDAIMAARQLKRWITPQNELIEVQPDNADANVASIEESIINSCLELLSLNYHVVIITKDSDLILKANSIGLTAHTIDEVKINAKNKQKVKFDIKKIKRSISNENSLCENLLETGTSQTDKKQNEFLFQNVLEAQAQQNEFCFTKGLKPDRNEFQCQKSADKNKFIFQKCSKADTEEFQFQNSSKADQKEFPFQKRLKVERNENHFQNGSKAFFRNENESNNQPVPRDTEHFNKEHSNQAMADQYTAENEMTFELKGIEDRIKTRMDEYVCSFTQIMEDCLTELLWNCNNVLIKPPWSLHEASQCINRVYGQDDTVKLYSDSLIMMLFYNCDKHGKLKLSMTPYEFTQLFVCGYSLITSLKPIVSKKYIIQETEVSLRELQNRIQNFATDSEFEFEKTGMSNMGDVSETDNNRRNYVKGRWEIIEYLKNHFKDWKSFMDKSEDMRNYENKNPDIKVVRTIGKNMNSLIIDRNKNMTLEIFDTNDNPIEGTKNESLKNQTEKDKTIMIKQFKPIVDFEDRLKKNLTCKDDKSKRHSNDDVDNVSLLAKQIESNLTGGVDRGVESEFLTVDDTTNDSGFETDSCAPVKTFLTELSGAFKLTYGFIKIFIKDQRKKEFDKDEQDTFKNKINEYKNILLNIIKQLHRIIVRESNEGTTLKAYLLRTGDVSREDYRITKYRQVVIKCLEQAQILEKALQLMLSIFEGCEVSLISCEPAIQYYNIFQ